MRLPQEAREQLEAALTDDDAQRARLYPGPLAGRAPVHTAYIPADQFTLSTLATWGTQALTVLDAHGPAPTGDGAPPEEELQETVRAKLLREPIEDLRIDFEDGYGIRPDATEDADATTSAEALGTLILEGHAPPFFGLRIKSFDSPALRSRSVRTLDLFLSSLLEKAGVLPAGFRLTLPKVTSVAQVAAMAVLSAQVERAYGLPPLATELQIEMPQAILGSAGTSLVAPMITATEGRCIGLHYGTYDYSAAVGIGAAYQSMEHPAADHAKAVMQVAAAGRGVAVSDGSTNILPVGDAAAVAQAWALHARLVRRSLERGFYQGWDLHPAQLPTRYAATYRFYRAGLDAAVARLRNYLGAAQTGVMDEPATAAALAGYLLRGIHCGGVDEADVLTRAGVDRQTLDDLLARRPLA